MIKIGENLNNERCIHSKAPLQEGVRFGQELQTINNNNLIQKDIMDGLIGGQEKNENN